MRPRVSSEDFVIAWATAQNVEEVCRTTGMRKDAVVARASALRKLGVNLPKLTRQRHYDSLRISQLNALVKKHDIRRRK